MLPTCNHGRNPTERMNDSRCLRRIILELMLLPALLHAQWFRQTSNTTERLRAVSVVNESVAWASGNHGTCVRTTDGGILWQAARVPDADSLDFRDVEAFNDQLAFVLSIGPGELSRIYKTTDGGSSWVMKYIATDPRIFLDEFAFWDSDHGIAVGDELDGHLFLLRTDDGGEHWERVSPSKLPKTLPGEGAFAASGSGITVHGSGNVWIGTGVKAARVFHSTDRGETWDVSVTPLIHETESSGIFSVAFCDSLSGIIVGGDYKRENAARDNAALTNDGGRSWVSVKQNPPSGFRSGVMYLTKDYLITVGPSGSDFSNDGGRKWKQIDMIGYHAVGKARVGNAIWAVGEKGRIGHFVDLIVR